MAQKFGRSSFWAVSGWETVFFGGYGQSVYVIGQNIPLGGQTITIFIIFDHFLAKYMRFLAKMIKNWQKMVKNDQKSVNFY